MSPCSRLTEGVHLPRLDLADRGPPDTAATGELALAEARRLTRAAEKLTSSRHQPMISDRLSDEAKGRFA